MLIFLLSCKKKKDATSDTYILNFHCRSPIVPEALVILRNASTTEEGEFGWPAPRKDAADWLLEETSRNIKTTSYGKYNCCKST